MRTWLVLLIASAGASTINGSKFLGNQDIHGRQINQEMLAHYFKSHWRKVGPTQETVNHGVDEMIESFHYISSHQQLNYALIQPLWEDKDLNCITNGRIMGLSTIQRNGDAIYKSEGNNATLYVSLKMKFLGFRLLVCRGKEFWGRVDGTVDSNSIGLNITLIEKDSKCTPQLNDISLQIGPVQITQRMPFYSSSSSVTDAWVISYFNDTIVKKVNESLKKIVTISLKSSSDLCERIGCYSDIIRS